jgi:NAD(P)H-hydrate repair Nnr-like enzyme with NAD(P)H-hydrate epimerase domain
VAYCTGLSIDIPSGVQSPTGKPPLASPGHAPPIRASSDRNLSSSAASTPNKPAALAGSGGSGNIAAATAKAIKSDCGRFKVYEVSVCFMGLLSCSSPCLFSEV